MRCSLLDYRHIFSIIAFNSFSNISLFVCISIKNKKSTCKKVCTYQTKLSGQGQDLGPVVQSILSLTSSLRVISLTVLADSIYNILIFFAEKM